MFRFSVLVMVLSLGLCAQSQLGSGSIGGQVIDPTGQSVAGAQVVITNTATGLRRQVASGSNGSFHIPVLPPGEYSARVTQTGFSVLDQTNIVVNVGSTATIIAKLTLGQVTETVTVESQSLVDTAKTDVSDLVNRQAIQDLPINGRRVDQFALLSTGVARSGSFGLLSFHGQSGNFNNYLIEGNDDNQAYFSEPRGRTRIASSVSANAVQEFQVGKGAYSAEFGRSIGGAINTLIRSGGNALHADGFYYFRNQDLQARDPLASIKPEELRQQFGGSVSGPIQRDKLFVFVNYDQQMRNFPILIEDLNNVLQSGRPTLVANPTPVQQTQYNLDLNAFNTGSAFLKSKFPNGAPGNTQTRNLGQNLSLIKSDYLINSTNTLSVFYNFLRSSGERAIQSSLVLPNVGRNGSDDVRVHSLNAKLTSILDARKVNEFRFQLGRDFEFEFADQPPPQTTINFGGNPFSFGRATFLDRPAYPDEWRQQFVNNFSYTLGSHSFKFGGELNRVHDNINNPSLFGGQYIYATALAIGRDLVDPTAKNYTAYNQNFGVAGIPFSTIDYAFFAQDQWKATRRMTVNYGLRYDYAQFPSPVVPNPAIKETQSFHSDKTAFGPRLGVAYDVRGNGRMILRGGYALYYARVPNGLLQNALAQTGITDPTKAVISLSLQPTDVVAPLYPNLLTAIPPTASVGGSVFRLDSKFRRPRVQDLTFAAERQVFTNTVVSATYIYSKGQHLQQSYDANLPAPKFERRYLSPDGTSFTVPFSAGVIRTAAGATQNINLSRPNPAAGATNVASSRNESWYNAMFLELRRRYSRGVQLSIGYTLAKAENLSGSGGGNGSSAEGAFGGGTPADQFNLASNRGLSPSDQRQRLNVSGIWEPRLRNGGSRARLVNGFRFSGIYTAESGRAVSSLVNVPSIPFLGGDGAVYNGFGGLRGQGSAGDRNLLPTVARNGLVGENNFRVDLRIARDFSFSERLKFEVLAEGFNIFNRSNYNSFFTTAFNAAATTNATPLSNPVALTPVATFFRPNGNGSQPDGTNARRFQLSARFRF